MACACCSVMGSAFVTVADKIKQIATSDEHGRMQAERRSAVSMAYAPGVRQTPARLGYLSDDGATTLYAARGRLIPFSTNSPTGSTFTAFSTFVSTRGLMRIWPGLASSQSREAALETVPIAA